MTLKISDNDNTIKNEILDGQFSNNMSDHILYLPSFINDCLLYTSPSPRDYLPSRMQSSAG